MDKKGGLGHAATCQFQRPNMKRTHTCIYILYIMCEYSYDSYVCICTLMVLYYTCIFVYALCTVYVCIYTDIYIHGMIMYDIYIIIYMLHVYKYMYIYICHHVFDLYACILSLLSLLFLLSSSLSLSSSLPLSSSFSLSLLLSL